MVGFVRGCANLNLSELARPKVLEDVVGQEHLLGSGKPFLDIAKSSASLIFYGPSGTGKTSVAKIIAKNCDCAFYEFNATQCSILDVKKVITSSNSIFNNSGVLIYLDEIQNFNKRQQQSLLSCLEDGRVKLIASTTESPFFALYGALLSRCLVFEFKPVSDVEICKALKRAVDVFNAQAVDEIKVDCDVLITLASRSCGDVRRGLNLLQACFSAARGGLVSCELADEVVSCVKSQVGCALNSDVFFDLLSALQKSIRGSDENAAVYYLARILNENTLIAVCRRLLVIASEDVGLAYPNAIVVVKACVDAAEQIGMPQARIVLAQAVIFMAILPKSNSSYVAMAKAVEVAERTSDCAVPRHLQNVHCDGFLNKNRKENRNYVYPHDFENHYVCQDYLPEKLVGRQFFEYSGSRFETNAKNYRDEILKQAKHNKNNVKKHEKSKML